MKDTCRKTMLICIALAGFGVIALRANDNLEIDPPYIPGSGPGAWVPGPSPVGVGLGTARPLVLLSGDQFRPNGPPALDRRQYFSASEHGEFGAPAISPGLSPSGSPQQFDPVNADAFSPACKEANSKALGSLHAGRFADAGRELSEFLGSLDHYPENALCSGVTQSNLAYAFRDVGHNSEAEHAARRSVESFEASLGLASPWLCRPLSLLVALSLERGNLREAGAILSRIESLPLSKHEDLALVKGLRANLLEQSQNLRRAVTAYRDSIAEWEKAGQGSSPDIVPELANLALVYEKSGHITQALATLERAWHIVDKPSGDANTRVRLLLAFAGTLAKQRDSRRTEGYFQQAIALLDSVPPALRQVDGQATYQAYQAFLKEKGRNREASAIEKRAVALFGPGASSSVVRRETLLAK